MAAWCAVLLASACAHAGDANSDGMQACQNGESRACYPGPASEVGVGACRSGTEQCVDGAWGACTGAQTAVAELCGDSIDNDCDGEVNDGCPCTYTRSTGQTSDGTSICCTGMSTLFMVTDCGMGDNHSVQTAGNCGIAHEGNGNGGSACVAIMCQGKLTAGTCM